LSYPNEIPREVVAEIVSRTDLFAVVSPTVSLKRVGSYWMGKCPFHPDNKTPSFSIRIGGHTFRCFGCNVAGDAITFLKLLRGQNFPEIVRDLADRCGVTIPEKPLSQVEMKKLEQRHKDWKIIDQAQEFFVKNLRENGESARKEVLDRGYDISLMHEEGLGYSGPGWDDLVQYLVQHRVSLERASQLGLIAPRKSGGFYDRFRDRLTFPIRNEQKKVIAFGGRALRDDEGAKYLNSPESPLYKKSACLYRLGDAKVHMQKAGSVVLTEGYFDALALVAAGYSNVVATCGTAFTAEQGKLLKRYCRKVITAFDGDRAGLKATVSAIPILADLQLEHAVIPLSEGNDPDSVWKKEGVDGIRHRLQTPVPAMDFVLDHLWEHGQKSLQAKSKSISRMAQYLAMIVSPVDRELYRQKAAKRFGVVADLLEVRYEKKTRFEPKGSHRDPQLPLKIEEVILGTLLNFPELIAMVSKEDVVEKFRDQTLKTIASQIVEDYEQYQTVLLDSIMEAYPETPISLFKSKTSQTNEIEIARKTLEDCFQSLKIRVLKLDQEKLIEELRQAEHAGDEHVAQEVLKQLQGMIEKQKELMN
jgi:DNA primase